MFSFVKKTVIQFMRKTNNDCVANQNLAVWHFPCGEKANKRSIIFYLYAAVFYEQMLKSLTDSTIDGKLTNVESDNVNTMGQICGMT